MSKVYEEKLPAELSRHQITEGGVLRRILVHVTDESFAARLGRVSELFEHAVYPR